MRNYVKHLRKLAKQKWFMSEIREIEMMIMQCMFLAKPILLIILWCVSKPWDKCGKS